MPAFVRAVLSAPDCAFDRVSLFEPDPVRRATTCRLAVGIGDALGRPGVVTTTDDVEEACTGADFVFSAIRVGGDRGRVIDEQVALRRGLVGQETTGAGGCAMALRTVPVVLAYCQVLERCAPGAVLINFTNPAGVITQAIASYSSVRAVGVCDTPSATVEKLAAFFGADRARVSYRYGGLNHLGWVTSFCVDGEERTEELLHRYEDLQRYDHAFAALDPALVRRVGALPTEYLFYYYDSGRYVRNVGAAGASRGQDVLRMNQQLLTVLGQALSTGDVAAAWSVYAQGLGLRRDTYMSADTGQQPAGEGEGPGEPGRLSTEAPALGGYEAVALSVVKGMESAQPTEVIVNTRNGTSVSFLDPGDVVEVPAMVSAGGIAPAPSGELPGSAIGLICQVKEYERTIVEAAVTGDASLAAVGLSLHPLVPGISVARELIDDYRREHGPDLAHLR
jgi:6-phospho-beta-glucosidase